MAKVLTAETFLKKYGKNHLDQEEFTVGFQNNRWETAEIENDFSQLKSADKYIIFQHLVNNADSELLKKLTGFEEKLPQIIKNGLAKHLDDFTNQIASQVKGNENGKQTWEIRLAIAQGLFTIGEMLEIMQRQQDDCEEIKALREFVYEKLCKLYDTTRPESAGGNKYFNTDGDVLLKAGAREYMFDHLDCNPYRKEANYDPDKDGVTNFSTDDVEPLDTAPKNPKQWVKMKEGRIYRYYSCDVSRSKEGYTIKTKIRLNVVKDYDERETLQNLLDEPKFREAMAQQIHEFYIANRAEDAANIDLVVEFVGEGEFAHETVDITIPAKITDRENSNTWLYPKTTTNPGTMLHEILHRLELEDYYDEKLVHDGRRDRTINPGFERIDPENIMNGQMKIRAFQLKEIIATAVKYRSKELSPEEAESSLAEAPSDDPIDRADNLFTNKYFLDYVVPLGDVLLILNDIQKLLEKDPNDTALLRAAAKLEFILGNDEAAFGYIDRFVAICIKTNSCFKILSIVWDCKYAGRKNKAIEILKPYAFKDEYFFFETSKMLLEEKRYDEFCKIVGAAGKKFAKDNSFRVVSAIANMETGDKEKALEVLRKIFTRDFFDKEFSADGLKHLIVNYFLDKGYIEWASEFYFIGPEVRNGSDFAGLLYEKGLYDLAISISEDRVKVNPLDTGNLYRLIESYRRKNDYHKMAYWLLELFNAYYILETNHHLNQSDEIKDLGLELNLTDDERPILAKELAEINSTTGPLDTREMAYYKAAEFVLPKDELVNSLPE